jgi:hypothetical protein
MNTILYFFRDYSCAFVATLSVLICGIRGYHCRRQPRKNPAGKRGIKFRGHRTFGFHRSGKNGHGHGLNWFSLDKVGHWIWTVFSLDGLVGFFSGFGFFLVFLWIWIHILCS